MEIKGQQVSEKSFDVLIVGGGGSGLRAALENIKIGLEVAVISKVFQLRSHTVAAQGGITCAIASADPDDDWRWHMFDTIKGSDYIGDQDAIEYMCSEGPEAVLSLNIWDYHFLGLKTAESTKGRLRGQSKEFGEGGQAARTCAAADRTGHALLHTLYQANLAGTKFLNEWFAVDLIENSEGAIGGISCFDMETGEIQLYDLVQSFLQPEEQAKYTNKYNFINLYWRWIRYGSKKWITSARYGNVAVSPYRVVW